MAQPENAAAQAAVLPRDPSPPPALPAPAELLAAPDYRDFYRAAFRPLVVYLIVYGATPAEAEDAAENALVYMLRRWPITGSPLAYAKIAAGRYFLKARRADRRHAAPPPAACLRPHDADDGQIAEVDSRDWVTDVLSHLTPAEREVMELAADGLNYHDIADIANISENAARQRAFAARKKLRALLDRDGTYRQPDTQTDNERSQVHSRSKEAR